MASSVGDLGRKLVDRAKTVGRRDWDEAKKTAREFAEVSGFRGSSKGRSKRKAASRSSR